MAQNVTVNGQNYSAVPAVQIPKTGGGTAQFTDVSDTTAVAADVNSGKYVYLANGQKVAGLQTVYNITKSLVGISASNTANKVIGNGTFYSELIPGEGYLISSVSVTMGGVDITDQVFTGDDGTVQGFSLTSNLTYCFFTDIETTESSFYAVLGVESGYVNAQVTIMVGGIDMSNYYTGGIINIPNVTGDIVVTAVATAATVSSISAAFNQGQNVIYDTDSLNDLKQYLTVTATYEGGATTIVTGYTLSGTLTIGTSTITVSYSGKTTTFNVTVTSAPVAIKGFTIGPLSGTINVGFSSNNNRAALACAVGTHAYPKHSGTLSSDYYPIPIPSGATSMIVTMPSELYVGARTFVWNSAQNYYDNTDGLSSPWTASNASTFDVSSYNDGTWFAGFTFKVGTAGSTDMRNYDMSDVSINFE